MKNMNNDSEQKSGQEAASFNQNRDDFNTILEDAVCCISHQVIKQCSDRVRISDKQQEGGPRLFRNNRNALRAVVTDARFITVNSLFMGTFNINASPLTQLDAHKWLRRHGAHHADVVILAFQECATCRKDAAANPYPSNVEFDKSTASFCRVNDNASKRHQTQNDPSFLCVIQSALSDEHTVMVDVSMGESPTFSKVPSVRCGKPTEWYGYIRLLVYAKQRFLPSLSTGCVTVVCPTGTKPSCTPDEVEYPVNGSPDKGSVCVFIPCLQVLICNVHLQGTNQYGTSEGHFDRIRRAQLSQISNACEETLMDRGIYISDLKTIVLGDFNFRCEMFTEKKDKCKGGRDFQAVETVLKSMDSKIIRDLFFKYDRLLKYLNGPRSNGNKGTNGFGAELKNDEEDDLKPKDGDGSRNRLTRVPRESHLPCLLQHSVDLFWNSSLSSTTPDSVSREIIMPTFTFALNSTNDPRLYSDKRTPSWTDRIVIRKALLNGERRGQVVSLGTENDIVISDHIPVYCSVAFDP